MSVSASLPILTLIVLAAIPVALGACGGDDGPIPGEVGLPLADRADQVASELEEGDDCTAAQLADELQGDLEDSGDRIPADIRAEIETTVQRLVDEVNCEAPPTETVTAPPPEDEPKPEECPKELKDAIKKGELSAGEDSIPSECLKHLGDGKGHGEGNGGGGGEEGD